jgi:hypothetical protein
VVGDFSGTDNVALEIKNQIFYSGFLKQKTCMPFALKMHIDTSKLKNILNFSVISGDKVKINQDFVLSANNAHIILIEYDGVKAELKIDTRPPKDGFFCDFLNKITGP